MTLILPLLAQDSGAHKGIFLPYPDHSTITRSSLVARLAEPRLALETTSLASLAIKIEAGLMGPVLDQIQFCPEDGSAETKTLQMLLALILSESDGAVLAARLITRFGSLGSVVAAPAELLSTVAGVATPIIALLKLVHHALFRITHAEVKKRPVIGNWDRLFDYLTVSMAYEPVEQLRVLFLDNRNTLIADEVLSRGTVNFVSVHPREVVKRTLALEATAIILVHNHPSGCSDPSQDDIIMTKGIQAALQLLDIALHDHVIIGKGNSYSFRKNGGLAKS